MTMTLPPPAGFERINMRGGFGAVFGPVLLRHESERVSLGFRVDERHVNVGGVCHGGAMATFADLQLAGLQRSGVVELGHFPTISLSVDYLDPAGLHDWIEGDVILVKRTRRLLFTQAILCNDAGPVARTHAMYSGPARPIPPSASASPPAAVTAPPPSAEPPEGFEPVGIGPGFGASFGPVSGRAREDGAMTLGFRVAPKHVNINGVCHGGAMATFADSQIAALRRLGAVPPGHCPTISLSIDYLGPARLGDWVESDVALIRATRRYIFTQAIMSVGSGPVARSTAIYASPRPAG